MKMMLLFAHPFFGDSLMAKAAKSAGTAAAKTGTRKRLTPDQKAEIARALAGGETGKSISERMGVSAATIYAQGRKVKVSSAAGEQGESALRKRLVSFAVRSLLGQPVEDSERTQLEQAVREEVVRRVSQGI
jgi:transposase-like protein